MNVLRLASFSEDGIGGNPAGVCILNEFPSVSDMQACAKAVGFSETAFACLVGQKWRVRNFAKMRKSCKSLIFLVPKAGLEPARPLRRGILNPLRLPFRHLGPIGFLCEGVKNPRIAKQAR